MRSVVFKVFIFDGISKLFLVISSLFLIKYLSIDAYSMFVVVFTCSMIAYQGVGSVVERLYIAEYEQYIPHHIWTLRLLLLIGGGGFFVYVFLAQGVSAAVVFILIVLVSVHYQVERIKLQRVEKYNKFIVVEFFRNLCWLLLVFSVFWFTKEREEYYSLLGYFIATGLGFFLVKRISREVDFGAETLVVKEDLLSAIKYLWDKNKVVLYSVVSAIFPYFAFIVVGLLGSQELIAAYGAALRYQAMFSMAVYAANVVLIARMANNLGQQSKVISDFFKVIPWLLLVVFSASVFVWWLIPIIDGGKYPETQVSFIILAACSLCSLLAAPFVNFLLSKQEYEKMLKSLMLGVVVFFFSLPVLFFLNESYGILFSLVAAYISILVSNIIFSRKEMVNESIDS